MIRMTAEQMEQSTSTFLYATVCHLSFLSLPRYEHLYDSPRNMTNPYRRFRNVDMRFVLNFAKQFESAVSSRKHNTAIGVVVQLTVCGMLFDLQLKNMHDACQDGRILQISAHKIVVLRQYLCSC